MNKEKSEKEEIKRRKRGGRKHNVQNIDGRKTAQGKEGLSN